MVKEVTENLTLLAFEYLDKFGSHPNVTTVSISEAGRKAYIEACKKAIETNTPLTKEEEFAFEKKYNGHLYEKGAYIFT